MAKNLGGQSALVVGGRGGYCTSKIDGLPVWATINPSPLSPTLTDRHLTSSTYVLLANQLTL